MRWLRTTQRSASPESSANHATLRFECLACHPPLRQKCVVPDLAGRDGVVRATFVELVKIRSDRTAMLRVGDSW
jgi:hypothetical protein